MKRILSSITHRPLLKLTTSDLQTTRNYGTTLNGVPEETFDVQQNYSAHEREEMDDQNWRTVDEEWEEQWESALEDRGLYRGNYTRLVILYTLVPLSFLVIFLLLAFFPSLFFKINPPPPLPLTELLLSISFYSLTHLIRIPLFSFCSFTLPFSPTLAAVIHRALITLITILLRLLPLPILSIPQTTSHHPTWRHPAFVRVWFVGLGWGLADALAGIYQGYEHLSLYQHVLVPDSPSNAEESGDGIGMPVIPPRFLTSSPSTTSTTSSNDGHGHEHSKVSRTTAATDDSGFLTMSEDELELQIDRDLEQLLALKGREEVEEIYGMPFIRIPVFISCLIRINALIHTLGLTLLLSAAYIRSSISTSSSLSPFTSYRPTSNQPLAITFPVVFLVHFLLLTLHSPPLLARVGVHTASYVGFLVGLGVWFAGMGVWEAVE